MKYIEYIINELEKNNQNPDYTIDTDYIWVTKYMVNIFQLHLNNIVEYLVCISKYKTLFLILPNSSTSNYRL